jgi:(1->4)-alpha-D-glucan 1-alpha-D-glucosylmutase
MPPPIPIATYRVQLTPQFGFDDAAAIVPYLKALGVSHLYSSPFLKARAGTTHGYDIVDHTAFNPEFGGEPAFYRMSDALLRADMGLILDFVPNHMAVHAADNAWWLDVLEWGPRSPYAKFFDIDWDSATGPPRVLLPILGRTYGEALEAGEIELRYDATEGSFSAWYFEHRLPIGPNRYSEILQKIIDTACASDQPAGQHLIGLAARYRGPRNPTHDKAVEFKRAIAGVSGSAEIIERGLTAYRPQSGDPGAVLALHHLLERQHYRAADWRLAQSDINYRRFFDINALAGLRVEDADVYKAIHPLVFRLIAEGRLQGLRLDHIDGLRDPHQYARRLQRDLQGERRKPPLYIIVEKILGEGEAMPRFAGVAGTTGYEWLNVISRVLLEPRGLQSLDGTWRDVSGDSRNFDMILRQSKQQALGTILSSEFTVLARLLARIAIGHYSTRDYTAERLRKALELFVLNFPVYRTYISSTGPSAMDRETIEAAIAKSRSEWFGTDAGIFDFLRDALTLDLVAPDHIHHSITRVRRFAFKVQQFTGPMMAKSLEDTAFYRFHRLLALNEVGGEPACRAMPLEEFHKRMAGRAASGSLGLTATATHDTKRGEDARARLLALAELADEWNALVKECSERNRSWIQTLAEPRPTPAHEYMICQSLLGAWPIDGIDDAFVKRSTDFAIKAAREGKEQTSWYTPNERYEANLRELVAGLLERTCSADFRTTFGAFAKRLALLGALNSLTQLVLKMTLPGVPDLYQGTEHWELSYVDPDNRRPVDFARRQRSLDTIGVASQWPSLAAGWPNGDIKFALTRALLVLRHRFPKVFLEGGYCPVEVTGPHRDEIIAYARSNRESVVVVAAGRYFARATDRGAMWPKPGAWDASLNIGGIAGIAGLADLRDALSDSAVRAGPEGTIAIRSLFNVMPIAILQGKRI